MMWGKMILSLAMFIRLRTQEGQERDSSIVGWFNTSISKANTLR